MKTQTTTLVAPTCQCCRTPALLIPRDDLPGGMATCPNSGQLYLPEGTTYVPAAMPPLSNPRPAPSVQIDLSREGYA